MANNLQLHQMPADSIDHKAGGILTPRLFENIGAVGINRALRDKEFVGNLLIGQSATDAEQNLNLARRQFVR